MKIYIFVFCIAKKCQFVQFKNEFLFG